MLFVFILPQGTGSALCAKYATAIRHLALWAFPSAVRADAGVNRRLRLCQHILKLKPLYPCKLPGNRVGKRIRPAFSYL